VGTAYTDKAYRWNQKITPVNGDIWAFVIKLLAGFWLNSKSWSYSSGLLSQSGLPTQTPSCLDSQYPAG